MTADIRFTRQNMNSRDSPISFRLKEINNLLNILNENDVWITEQKYEFREFQLPHSVNKINKKNKIEYIMICMTYHSSIFVPLVSSDYNLSTILELVKHDMTETVALPPLGIIADTTGMVNVALIMFFLKTMFRF